MRLLQAFFLIIILIQLNVLSSENVFTFEELGLSLTIISSGSIYKFSTLSLGKFGKTINVKWIIYWDADFKDNSSIEVMIGFNNINKSIELSKNPIIEYLEASLLDVNRIWLNVTVYNANLTIFGNSSLVIREASYSEAEVVKAILRAIFVAGIIVPIVLFITLKILDRRKVLGGEEWEL